MSDLTKFRAKIENRLNEAKEVVRKYEDHLTMIDAELHGDEIQFPETSVIKPEASMLLVPPQAKKESFAGKTRKFILGLESDFHIRGVALILLKEFPDTSNIDEGAMIRKVSSAVWRLKKEGKVIVIHKGAGSEPNTYRVVLSKGDNAEFLD